MKKNRSLLSFDEEEGNETVIIIPKLKHTDEKFKFIKRGPSTSSTFKTTRNYDRQHLIDLKSDNSVRVESYTTSTEPAPTTRVYKNENDEIVEDIIETSESTPPKSLELDQFAIEKAKLERLRKKKNMDFIPLVSDQKTSSISAPEKDDDMESLPSDESEDEVFDEHKGSTISFGVSEKKARRVDLEVDADEIEEGEGWEDQQLRNAGFTPMKVKKVKPIQEPDSVPVVLSIEVIRKKLFEVDAVLNDTLSKQTKYYSDTMDRIDLFEKSITEQKGTLSSLNDKYILYQSRMHYVHTLVECLIDKCTEIEFAESEMLDAREKFYGQRRQLWIQYQNDMLKNEHNSEELKRIEAFESLKDNVFTYRAMHDVFGDVNEDYASISSICQEFEEWKRLDPTIYRQAYIEESLAKIYAPFVRMELFQWNPLSKQSFVEFEWFQLLNPYAKMVPEIVSSIVLPLAEQCARTCYNPFSPKETGFLVTLMTDLKTFHADTEVMSASVIERIQLFVDCFIFDEYNITSQFLNDQYQRGLVLLKNIVSWKGKLPLASLKSCINSLINQKMIPVLSATQEGTALIETLIAKIPQELMY